MEHRRLDWAHAIARRVPLRLHRSWLSPQAPHQSSVRDWPAERCRQIIREEIPPSSRRHVDGNHRLAMLSPGTRFWPGSSPLPPKSSGHDAASSNRCRVRPKCWQLALCPPLKSPRRPKMAGLRDGPLFLQPRCTSQPRQDPVTKRYRATIAARIRRATKVQEGTELWTEMTSVYRLDPEAIW